MTVRRKEQMELRTTPEACAVAVVYDNLPARDLAIEVCDALVQKFVGDLEFDITWWRFNYLTDPLVAGEAADAAARADLIVVIFGTETIPREVQAWFERWLSQRGSLEGALVVGQTSVPLRPVNTAADAYLRLAAERAHLDYLPLFGPDPSRLQDKLSEDGIFSDPDELNRPPDRTYLSSGWGINE